MKWEDKGILINTSKFGETDLIGTFITFSHGLTKGLIKGGISKKQKSYLQPGNKFNITWKSRLEEQLGFFILDPIKIYGASLFNSELKLKLLSCMCNILYDSMAENHPAQTIYNTTNCLLDCINNQAIYDDLKLLYHYNEWEKTVIKELGFAFKLDKCNVTGITNNLCYISPNTGHAISKFVGEKYKAKLLPLPQLWKSDNFLKFNDLNNFNINEALKVLEFFYNKRIYIEKNKKFPYIRKTLYIN